MYYMYIIYYKIGKLITSLLLQDLISLYLTLRLWTHFSTHRLGKSYHNILCYCWYTTYASLPIEYWRCYGHIFSVSWHKIINGSIMDVSFHP